MHNAKAKASTVTAQEPAPAEKVIENPYDNLSVAHRLFGTKTPSTEQTKKDDEYVELFKMQNETAELVFCPINTRSLDTQMWSSALLSYR